MNSIPAAAKNSILLCFPRIFLSSDGEKDQSFFSFALFMKKVSQFWGKGKNTQKELWHRIVALVVSFSGCCEEIKIILRAWAENDDNDGDDNDNDGKNNDSNEDNNDNDGDDKDGNDDDNDCDDYDNDGDDGLILLSSNYDGHPGNNYDNNSDKRCHNDTSNSNDNNYRVILPMTIATTATMFAVTIIRMTTAKTMTTMTKATITKIIRLGGGIAPR